MPELNVHHLIIGIQSLAIVSLLYMLYSVNLKYDNIIETLINRALNRKDD